MNDVNAVMKTFMKEHDISQVDIAKLFDVSPQAIYNKFRRGTWDVAEVAKVVESVGCRLVIESGPVKRYLL